MGRWASQGRTEASLTLPPPVKPLLTGLRQAEAGLGIKQSSVGVNFSFVCFFLTFLILIRVLFSGQVSRFPLTADEVSADGISSAKRVTC